MSQQTKNTMKLGAHGPEVFPLGLGCMGMSDLYGRSDEKEAIATIHAALDAGVTFLDTGDFYGMGANEMLVGRAIADRRANVQVSVKFGALRGPDGSWLGVDGRPAAVKSAAAYSLRRLGVEAIDVYRLARLDPNVPIEDTVGAIAELVQAGYVRHVGLSEVGAETVRRAHAVHPIVDLQIEHSLLSRDPETTIFPTLDELGVSATLYGLLSRGLLTGSKPRGVTDFRAHLPRFQGEARERNEALVARFVAFAEERGATPAQLAVAYARAKLPHYLPLVGARTRAQLAESLAGLALKLSADDVATLERLVPADEV
ncbi:MAG: aldo/keto reductase, partial [Myxococcales bacterium]|nr:aldo/keto reductase [Myxococcales bacterium]